MAEQSTINVEVVYALAKKQQIVALEVAADCTVQAAVEQAGMEKFFPGLDLSQAKLGLFGKVVSKPQQEVLKDGDRVEIYRPLIADPKEVRKVRAARVKAEEAAK